VRIPNRNIPILNHAMNTQSIYSWDVSVKGTDWHCTVNARTRGQAKHEYYRDVIDAWPNVPFTAMRCRKIGEPHTSDRFKNCAAYRGLPELKCGQRVRVGDALGTVVDHNESANMLVLFDQDSKYKGARLSVHPSGLEVINP
jgi:hypothetical protein